MMMMMMMPLDDVKRKAGRRERESGS